MNTADYLHTHDDNCHRIAVLLLYADMETVGEIVGLQEKKTYAYHGTCATCGFTGRLLRKHECQQCYLTRRKARTA